MRSYFGGKLKIYDVVDEDVGQRWPGSDRVASDYSTTIPLYPTDDEDDIVARWWDATSVDGA